MPVNTADHALLYELLRSFTTLGRTLNLSQAVKLMGTTRQTVRRHIALLENLRGQKLLKLVDRRYQLTTVGQESLVGAEDLLAVLDDWLTDKGPGLTGLSRTAQNSVYGDSFFAQQQPLISLWTTGEELLQETFAAWVSAEGWLEHPALAVLRSHLVVYRLHKKEWVCVSIGEESTYAAFVGPEFARSAIGLTLTDDPLHQYSINPIQQAYNQTLTEGSVRYDHVVRRVPEAEDHPSKFLSYQRLLLACRFPNGRQAIIVLSLASDKVDISSLPALQRMKLAQSSASVTPAADSGDRSSLSTGGLADEDLPD